MMLIRILLKMCVFVLCENNLINETPGRIGMISQQSEEMVGKKWWGSPPRNKEIGDVHVKKLPVQPLVIWALS